MSILRALVVLALATAAGADDVSITLGAPPAARPGQRIAVGSIVENRTPDGVADVRARITFDPSLAIEQESHFPLPASCIVAPGLIDCTKPNLDSLDWLLNFSVIMPSTTEGGAFVFNAEVTTTKADPNLANNTARTTVQLIRQHIVSNTNDSGAGSLRAAIQEANGWCLQERPCEIRFDFPIGTIAVIEPLSPLPALTACGVNVGDAPPLDGSRPPVRVEVNGRFLSAGHGLELRSACEFPLFELTGMRIIGFPGDGVVVSARNVYILHGFEILRNRGRGIAIVATAPRVEVNHALIAENRRSGIAAFAPSLLLVRQSRIGIGHDGDDRANGASGIFLAPEGGALDLRDSVIANHPHFGVALAGRGTVNISASTVITRNGLDLDWFLDGPSANEQRPDIPKTPRILSARYDPATNTTYVTASLQQPRQPHTVVRFYASDRITIFGTAHLDVLVGSAAPETEAFTLDITASGDLRGKYLSAVTTRLFTSGFPDSPPPEMRWVSEVSAAVRVE